MPFTLGKNWLGTFIWKAPVSTVVGPSAVRTSDGKKFIAGLPMKPATNILAG